MLIVDQRNFLNPDKDYFSDKTFDKTTLKEHT